MSRGYAVTYEIDVGGSEGQFIMNAEFLYETLSCRFVRDLLMDGTLLTDRFEDYFAMADKTPLMLVEVGPRTIR